MKLKVFFFISLIILFFSCERSKKQGLDSVSQKKRDLSTLANTKTNFNIYIENSGSMNGYVNTVLPTKFKICLEKIYGNIERSSMFKSGTINFINETICKQKVVAGDEKSFLNKLNKHHFENSGCDFKESALPEIIKKAITTNPNDINLLFSDCIISKNTKKDGPTVGWLTTSEENLRTYIKTELDKNELSCIILKMNSEFYGTYCVENKSQNPKAKNPILNGSNRPYYIIISGKPSAIANLMTNINFTDYKEIGFENSYYLLSPNPNSFVKTKILIKSNYDLPKNENKKIKKQRTIIKANEDNESRSFNFTLAANLDTLKIDNSFLIEKNNYEITNHWHIEKIEPNLDKNNLANSGYSHIFTIQTDSLEEKQNVTISLKYKLPNWVVKSSNTDDSNPLDTIKLKNQTFGIENLLNAFSQAYGKDKFKNKSMFETTVEITKGNVEEDDKPTKFSWWIFIVIAGSLGIFIYIKNKN